ncbi:MAG: T9SS type A sorting domain-containing protein [Bacteroidetes bacterium]|nr:T9SS type A sorting domain-containing protein [Bacteroidota bacterium]
MNFDVKISPNPSVSDFKLQILTSVIAKTTVKILGSHGGLIKEMILSPYQKNISLGSDLNAGTYIVEVRQGNNCKKTKLQKY